MASGHVEWQLGWDLCIFFRSKSLILEPLHQFKIVGYIFLTPTWVIAWHMQNLSSIHRLSEKFKWRTGFHGWGGKFENDKCCWKVTSVVEKWLSKMQNRFADAKMALRGTTEVTRRDGLSSLKNNILSAVGMLSGSWGGNYVIVFGRKVGFWKSCTNLKSLVIFF